MGWTVSRNPYYVKSETSGVSGVLPEDRAYEDSLDPETRKLYGVIVTPVEVVDFQVRGVVESLAVSGQRPWEGYWFDPCCGAGIYPERVLEVIPDRYLVEFVSERLWANDVLESAARWCKARIERRVSDRLGRPFDWGYNVSWVDTLEQVDLPWMRDPVLGWHAPGRSAGIEAVEERTLF